MDNIENTMIETLTSDLGGISSEILELGIDSLLKDGILKDIPIVNSIISVYNFGVSIRERFFIKKVIEFLYSLKDTTKEERVEFLNKHSKDKPQLGEKLIVILDRLDDIYKALLIGNVFSNYLHENINLVTFQRLSQIIDRCFVEDLKYLDNHSDQDIIKGYVGLSLSNCGITTLASFDGGTFDEVHYNPSEDYKINELGKMLIKYAFK